MNRIFFSILLLVSHPIHSQGITLKNWEDPPFNRWAFSHARRLHPTADVSRGDGPVTPLISSPDPIFSLPVEGIRGEHIPLEEALKKTFTDAFLVLKNGKVVAEWGDTRQVHILWSGTKSLIGLLTEIAAKEGKIDLKKTAAYYVPDLSESGYGDATIQQLLDMQVVPAEEMLTVPSEFTPDEFLPTVKKARPHGEVFFYTSMTTDVLAWALERATGEYLPDYLSKKIWSRIGAEESGYFLLDAKGRAKAGGGFNTSARDFARFGLAILQGTFTPDAFSAGNPAPFQNSPFAIPMPAGAYHNQWWKLNGNEGPFLAIGVYGQYLWIHPKENLVIVKLSSEPKPADLEYSFISMSIFDAIKEKYENH